MTSFHPLYACIIAAIINPPNQCSGWPSYRDGTPWPWVIE